jgi:hypothetical protein
VVVYEEFRLNDALVRYVHVPVRMTQAHYAAHLVPTAVSSSVAAGVETVLPGAAYLVVVLPSLVSTHVVVEAGCHAYLAGRERLVEAAVHVDYIVGVGLGRWDVHLVVVVTVHVSVDSVHAEVLLAALSVDHLALN